MILKEGESGVIIEGNADGDVLTWDAGQREWFPAPGGAIAPGSYDGQPVKWDGAAAYVPLPPGDALILGRIQNAFGDGFVLASDLFVEIDATTTFDVEAGAEANINSAGSISLTASTSFSTSTPGGGLSLDTLGASFSGGTMSIGVVGSLIGFYGATPVVRPVITGVTEQEQIDSLVAALVGLGLVTDGR